MTSRKRAISNLKSSVENFKSQIAHGHHTSENRPAAEPERLDVSPYDRASSLMISLLVTVGLATVVLVAGWLSVEVYQSASPEARSRWSPASAMATGERSAVPYWTSPRPGRPPGGTRRTSIRCGTRPKSGTPPPTRGPPKSRTLSVQRPERQLRDGPGRHRMRQEAARKAEQARPAAELGSRLWQRA